MRLLDKILIFLLLSIPCVAQTTVVTATVVFPDGNTFQNGTVLATFTPPGGIIDQYLYTLNGAPFPYYVNGTFDGTGTFTITLTDDHVVRPLGGRWTFTVCSVATTPCTNSLQDVFGATINLSTQISNDVKNIFAAPGYFPIYFQDSEINNNINGGTEYFDYATKTFRCWNSLVWANCGGGGGGGGSVVSFSAGNLPPIFTTNVATPTTTPTLTFNLSNAPANTVLANETNSTGLPSYSPDSLTINTAGPLTGGGTVNLGGSLTLDCPTCGGAVNITATSPIVVTPSPITGTGVISCPTCGTGTGSVSNFSAGNLSPLFTTSVTNPTTTPNLTFTLSTAPANSVYSNFSNSVTLPQFNVIPNCGDSSHGLGYTGGTGFVCNSITPIRGFAFTIYNAGGLTAGTTSASYTLLTAPFGCTLQAYNIGIDQGTITLKWWKVALGTAIPTNANSINTAGVGIASGTAIHSATLTDFTTTTINQNDMMAMDISAVAGGATEVNGVLQCQ